MSASTSGGERIVPYYCPYCGDEDLRPSEEGHGTWECRACARAFALRFVGLIVAAHTTEPVGRVEATS
jgi:ribosomal protein L37AE/L43A